MRAVDRDYTFWLAGYYDDFNGARAIPDDLNDADATTTYTHVSTHHGSAMASFDRLNTRFTYTYAERAQDAGYLGDDTQTSQRPLLLISSALAQKHNSGIHKWLTHDTNMDSPSKWDARAQLQYPCSLFGNRQKFNRNTSLDSYLSFCNGNDTSATYYCPAGDTDSTDGRSWTVNMNAVNPGATTLFLPYSGVTQQSNFRNNKTRHLVSFAGTYMGERNTRFTADANFASQQHFPIESPAGKPFFISQLYGPTATTSRIISYDGNLNAKGIEDTFTIRMAWSKLSDATLSGYTLKIGFDNSDSDLTFNKSTQAFSRAVPLVTLTFDPAAVFSAPLSWVEWNAGSQATINNDDIWYDIDVVLDFTAQKYTAYYNGVAFASVVSFGSKPTGGAWSPTDIHGWTLDAAYTLGSDGFMDLATFIDRAGLVLPLSDAVHDSRPPISDFTYKTLSNGISTMNVTISDDDDELIITPLITGNTLSEWWLLSFRDNINRPYWRGPIERISHRQKAKRQTSDISIVARDSLSLLQSQLPVWEHGQGGGLSMSNHASIGTSIDKRVDEIAGLNEIFSFGKSKLKTTESTLGYDTVKFGSYSETTNQRMSLNSAHPIQMYINEDTDGPNDVEDEWLGKESSFKLQDIITMHAYTNASYDYIDIYHTGPAFSATNSIVLTGTTLDATYTVHSVATYSTAYIANLKKTTIRAGSGTYSAGHASSTGKIFASLQDVDAVGQNNGKTVVKATLASSTHSFTIGNQLVNVGGNEAGWKKGEYITVTAVPTNTTIMFEIDDWPYASATVSSMTIEVGNATHWGSNLANTPPFTPARIYLNGLASDATFLSVLNRDSHSRWQRDLSLSPFFRAKFGIIGPNPTYATGNNTNLWKPVSSAVATARSWAANATWNGPAAFTKTATSFVIDEPGIFHSFPRDGSVAILDIIDNDTGEHDTLYATTCSTPNLRATTYDSANNRFTSTGSHSLAIYDIVVHEGFNNVRLNGIFQVCAIPTATAYDAIRLGDEPFVGQDNEIKLNTRILAPFAATPSSSIDPDGVYPLYVTTSSGGQTWVDMVLGLSDQYRQGIQPTGYKKPTNGDAGRMYYGSVTISGVKGQTRAWPQGSRLYHRKIDESNGYKHLWLLWADMRNNGEADADGGYRKKDFGLMLPTNTNYEVSLLFADQYDAAGQLDRYTGLKIGEDCDVWQFDSEVEPYTGGIWSAQTNASNDENYPTALNSWNTKAGAFVVVDTSPFWNLNTAANNGRPGYSSGGRVDLGDYETEHRGFPYLLDAYWREAASSYKNTGATIADHSNSLNWVNDGTILTSDIDNGDSRIFVHNNSDFAASGYGAILMERGSGRDAQKQIVYFHWGAKGTDATLGDFLGTASLHADSSYVIDYEDAGGPSAVRSLLDNDSSLWITGSQMVIKRRDPILKTPEEGWDSVTVYNTPAARFSLRLMMALDGSIISPNSGTYFEHDKIRTLFNCCIQQSWMQNGTLSCITDIQNTPISEKMTTTGLGYSKNLLGSGKGDMESFGSASDATSTILSNIESAQQTSGVGRDFDLTKQFTYLIGPDNRLDYRPTFPLFGKTFDRTTMKVSDLSSNMSSQINTVRIYYNGLLSFVDYPTPSPLISQRFKVMHYPNVKSKAEAEALAKEEHGKVSNTQTSVTAELIRDSTLDTFRSNSLMHKTARIGYISDACVHTLHEDSGTTGYGIQGASWWTARYGGCHYPGMVNASDTLSNATLGSATLKAVLKSEDSTTEISGVFPSSVTNIVSGTQDGRLVYTHSGTSLDWLPDVSIDASHQAQNVSAGGWFDFTVSQAPSGGGGAVNKTISVFVVAGDLPGAGVTTMHIWYAPCYRNDDWYFWWGSNSISYALQIVSIQDSMPIVSETSGEKLRVAISIETNNSTDTGYATVPSSVEDTVFRVWLLDYAYSVTTPSMPSSGTAAPQYTATLRSHSSILVRGSGFYEIAAPSTYSSTSRKIVFSFNAEYCKSIMRNRLSVYANAQNIEGISSGAGHYSTTEATSIFPLGQPNFGDIHTGLKYRRSWYSPRINIREDDLSFRCSTTIKLTDSHLDFTNEPMVIRGITWAQKGKQHETVSFDLERTASQYRYTLANFLKQKVGGGGGGAPTMPPGGPTLPPFPPGGGGWGGGHTGPMGQLPGGQTLGSSPKFTLPSNTPLSGADANSKLPNIGINDLSKTNMSIMRGRMDSPSDSLGSDVTWGVLGQKKVGPAMTSSRSIDGMDSVPTPSKGLTVFTSEGFVLPGIANPADGVFGETHTVTYDTRIPNDISDSLFSITALISYDTVGSGGVAKITTTAKCLETDNSVNQTIIIAQGEDRKKLTLLQPTTLEGLGTAGNTLRITIERTPGQSGDAGPYQAVRVHSLSVKPRRYTQLSKGTTNAFKPY